MKLIILDRDGVINYDSNEYIKSAEEWRPLPGSIEAIAKLSQAGYAVVVATNQSGLSRGLFGLDELETMHEKLRNLVDAAGGHIEGIYYCPHLPEEDCACRKPAPGLLLSIAEDFQTELAGVPLVGDSLRDLQAGRELGCRLMLVRTGKGKITENTLSQPENHAYADVLVYDNLSAAVAALLQV